MHTVLKRTGLSMWDNELSVDVKILRSAASLRNVLQRTHDVTSRNDFR